ncbi:MAG: hypothetical protein IKE63_06770 [Bacilli bacterium]|nr:hypothetical protein [Bacilli bacterium]
MKAKLAGLDTIKIAHILMTISFVMIISGGVSSFVLGLKADKLETQKRINVVNDEFEILSANTSVFETVRDELYSDTLSNVYYDTLYSDDKKIKEKLSNYENLVDELQKTTVKLDKLCKDVYYPDIEANTKCSNYKSIYEQVNNYFISDINLYNKNIDKYNEYQKNNNFNLKIEKYKLRKQYIDYDGDKKYDGKEG